MKRIITALTVILLCLTNITCFAESDVSQLNDMVDISTESGEAITEELPLLIDNADLLTDSEEKNLKDKLYDISNGLDCDVIVLTEASIDTDAQSYADDYFDYNGYGQGSERDGILLLVSMSPRNWHVSGSGICNSEYISTTALEYISENVQNDLKAEDYATCFNTYADRCEETIASARDGKEYKSPFNIILSLVVSLSIGFIVAFIVTGKMKSELKSVKFQTAAANYVKQGSLMVTDSREMYLYKQITHTERASNDDNSSSDSHTSSSGRSHSGTGGSF